MSERAVVRCSSITRRLTDALILEGEGWFAARRYEGFGRFIKLESGSGCLSAFFLALLHFLLFFIFIVLLNISIPTNEACLKMVIQIITNTREKGCESGFPYCFLTDSIKLFL